MNNPGPRVEVPLTFDDGDRALRPFHDVLGLKVLDAFDYQGGRGVIMRVPSATLELFDHEHAAMVDIETGASQGGGPRATL